MSKWWQLLSHRSGHADAWATEWWRMPLIGLLIGGPISFTVSLFLASYGARGPYGGFWRLFFAGMTASVPIFIAGGFLFAPLEIWLNRRPRRLRGRESSAIRGGVLASAGALGALLAYYIVIWLLPEAPPSTLLPVLLVTYSFIGALIGLFYTLYDEYILQLELSTRLTQEMRITRDIQQGLFPLQAPQIQGYSLAASCHPARETGGDFYDFYEFSDGRLGIVIADVSGKGMPAALLMANARSTWRAQARNGRGPAETLARVNRALCQDIHTDDFVTLLYAILDPETRQLGLSSAGHPLPLLHNDGTVQEIEIYGLPLGLKSDATYQEVRCTLSPGDTLLFYTDGVTESLNLSRELFGLERLIKLVQERDKCVAAPLVQRVLATARAYSGRAGQADDATVVVLKICELTE
jgi:serine phosphatase RsbU (regulator of sigma subunit)